MLKRGPTNAGMSAGYVGETEISDRGVCVNMGEENTYSYSFGVKHIGYKTS